MSYSITHKLYRTKTTPIREHRNGWGSGPVVWDFFEQTYLSQKQFSRQITNEMDEVWALHSRPDIPVHQRYAMFATFDYAYCAKDNLEEAADYLEKFAKESGVKFGERANHWAAIAEDYRAASKSKDKRLLGVCITCTSVSDIWEGRGQEGAKEAWSIFPELMAHQPTPGATDGK